MNFFANAINQQNMVKLFYRDDSLADKISYIHLVLFLVALPFDGFYSDLLLFSFAIHTFIHVRRQDFRRLWCKELPVLSSVYLLTVIGTIYTANKGQAISDWGRLLGIFLIPLLFLLNRIDLRKYRYPLLLAFSLTCTITVLYLYADAMAIILYNRMPLSSLFTPFFINHNFSEPIALHPTFLSMYSALSLICLVHFLLKESSRWRRVAYAVCIFILSAGMIQAGSKSILIAILVIVNFVLPFYYVEKSRRLRFMLLTLGITLLTVALIYTSDNFRNRYVAGLKTDLVADTTTVATADPRIVRWKAALNVVKKSPIIGHGSGDEVDRLKEEYFRQKLYTSYLFHLNTHNQYLAFLVKGGIIGLLVYLYTLYFGFRRALRGKNIFLMSFLLLVATVSFSENILDANKGVFFYAFFFSLFILPEAAAKTKDRATPAARSAFLKNDPLTINT